MPLPRRSTRSLGMMVAAIVLAAAVSLLAIVHSEQTRASTARSLAVLLALEEISSLLKDAETNQRGYLLSDAPQYR
ncbi:MAG: CHASE3 domain-containing protein [Myxococcaceae bacterium]|nr:CHASE3 domain-containing protein [Myxococcaceae bacterium]